MYLKCGEYSWKLQRKFLCKNARTQHKHWFLALNISTHLVSAAHSLTSYLSHPVCVCVVSFVVGAASAAPFFLLCLSLSLLNSILIRSVLIFVCLFVLFLLNSHFLSCLRRRYLLSFVGMSHNLSRKRRTFFNKTRLYKLFISRATIFVCCIFVKCYFKKK